MSDTQTIVDFFCNKSLPKALLLYTKLILQRKFFFAFLHLQAILSHCKFAPTKLCLKRDNFGHWNSPNYKFAS